MFKAAFTVPSLAMGGHHHPELPKIPDWRMYRVEDAPELVRVQKALAQHGLCDPWLRNEVWKFVELRRKITTVQFCKNLAFGGFKFGALAAAATIAIEFFFFKHKEKEHGHHGTCA